MTKQFMEKIQDMDRDVAVVYLEKEQEKAEEFRNQNSTLLSIYIHSLLTSGEWFEGKPREKFNFGELVIEPKLKKIEVKVPVR